MREILFRGKSINTKANWIYGYGVYDEGFYSKMVTYDDSFEDEDFVNYNFFKYEDVISETVGQFTGLCDKNGTKIFEGDIVKFKCQLGENEGLYTKNGTLCFIGEIVFEYSMFSARKNNENGGKDYLRLYSMIEQVDFYGGSIEVIGNIFDNPELMEDNA